MSLFRRRIVVPIALALGLAIPLGGIAIAAPDTASRSEVTAAQPAAITPPALDPAILDQIAALIPVLDEISKATDPAALKELLDKHVATLKEKRSTIPEALLPAYDAAIWVFELVASQLESVDVPAPAAAADVPEVDPATALKHITSLAGLLKTILGVIPGLPELPGVPLPSASLPVPVPSASLPGLPDPGLPLSNP